jgi:nicotinamide-nucleotide amidase
MNAEIVAIGSELLLGQIVDTNSAWMAQRLADLGINMFYVTVVGDNPGRMKHAISEALSRSNLVITSGGLGPTQDDLTREIVAEVTHRKLVLDQRLLQELRDRFQRRGRLLTPNNERQAYIPEGAIPVENPNGTAPSFIVEDPRGVIFALPGVPFELKWLFDNALVPYVRKKFGINEMIVSRVLKVAEIGESRVDDRIGHLIANSQNPTVGVLAYPGQVDVRITAKAASVQDGRAMIAPLEQQVRDLIGEHIFATDSQTMEGVVGELLRKKGLTISVYEDLSGGVLSERLLQASPESVKDAVLAGSKSFGHTLSLMDIKAGGTLDEVSLTEQMAEAVRVWSGADIGLAAHGLVDDMTQRENLSSGKTYVSLATAKGVRTRTYEFAGRGRPDQQRAGMNAMEFLRMTLLES